MSRRKSNENERKGNIISELIEMYDIKTASDIQEALKDLLGNTIENMLVSELSEHLGYEDYERTQNSNSRNGKKKKTIRSSQGELEISVPQDRNSTFEPQIVPKRKREIYSIEDKIISMYAKGMSTRQISEQIEDIYGFEVSETMVSGITNKLLPEIENWQKRPLSPVYPIVFIDAIHFAVRENNIVKKVASYTILGINDEGRKEVLSIEIGENESSKYWLSVLNSLKSRGVEDILILCSDGLSGLKESISVAFPKTDHQTCIVHMVRNTLRHVSDKDKKEFAKDLKSIYNSSGEKRGYEKMLEVKEKWEKKYPNSMKRWETNWDVISPLFKYSKEVRKIMYTTNAIESLHSGYRRLNRQRSVFPNESSLLKALYLSTYEISKKWIMPIRNWGQAYGELSIMYEGRLP